MTLRLPQRGSVRLRITLAATVVFAITAIGASMLLVHAVRSSIRSDVRFRTQAAVDEAKRSIEAGTPPNDIRIAPGNGAPVFLQIVNDRGDVVSAVAGPGTGGLGATGGAVDARTIAGGGELQISGRAHGATGVVTIRAASPLAEVQRSVDAVAGALWFVIPGLIALVGASAWFLTGRALRPVEAIRSQASTITARHLHRRVPAPTTDDEVARLAHTMNEMLDRLKTAQVRQQQFISDASHELRSPVASLQTAAEVALAHPDQRPWPDVIADILADASRLDDLVGELLATASLDERRVVSEPVDLGALVLAETDRVANGSIALDVAIESDVTVVADRRQVRTLVRNLVDNATRHAHARVAVSLTRLGDEAHLEVEDDGPGIPVDQREYVFERFARLDEARSRDAGGVGLGLPLGRSIAGALGGNAAGTARPGVGRGRF